METWRDLLIAFMGLVLGGIATWVIGWVQGKLNLRDLLKKLQDTWLDKEHVSVNEEFLMTQLLAKKIQDAEFSPDIIFGICPGGAMVAEWLSRRFLGNRRKPIRVHLINMRPDPPRWVSTRVVDEKAPISSPDPSRILLVNDISRGGRTLSAAGEFLKGQFPTADIKLATLICHINANEQPDYCAAMTSKAVRFDWKEYEKEHEDDVSRRV